MADKWQLWIAGACLTVVTGMAHADSLDAQRGRYLQIKQAWDSNQMDTVAQLMPTLRDYPLYPYLEYRELAQHLDQETGLAVNAFIKQYPTLPPVRSLPSRFVNELARREDWRGLLVFSPEEPKPVSARCNWYYAKWATGQQQVAWDGAKAIWLRGTSLPATCDKLFSVWQAAGQQTPITTLERMRLAMKEGNTNLVNFLAKQLPEDYQTMANAVMDLQNNPQTVVTFARAVGPTDFTRQATSLAFARVAREDAENARAMIPSLVTAQKMSDQEAQDLKEAVAWRLMGNDITSEQARWRDDVVMRSDSTSLIERRVRMSLGNNDRRGLNTWIARLPVEAKQKDEWQYWQADLLLEQGRKEEAEKILHGLMQERGFYPMVAAQKLGEEYKMQIDKAPPQDSSLTQGAEIARVRELMYWGMDNLARTEWSYLVSSKNSGAAAATGPVCLPAKLVGAERAGDHYRQIVEQPAGTLPAGLSGSVPALRQRQGDSDQLCDGHRPSGERLEPESALAGGGVWSDAGDAGYRAAYGEGLQPAGLQQQQPVAGSGNQYSDRHAVSGIGLSAVWSEPHLLVCCLQRRPIAGENLAG